ncbi:MAG: putative PIN family toxin of toxin-antitoxin system [Candidatus Nitrosomirales archaeon]|jgi:putative PIN family toxin of toxin-antitoxin system
MKIVLDTNVLISALIKQGKPRNLSREIIHNHTLIISKELLEELAITSNEPKILRYVNQQDIADFLRDLASSAEFVRTRSRFRLVKDDPEDDIVLRTAFDGKASYVASGDKHLLALKQFRRIKIVTVDEMLKILTRS